MAIHDMNQRAQDWLADHLQNFGVALTNHEDPSCLITLPHGIVVEIRLNELPGTFSRQTVNLASTETSEGEAMSEFDEWWNESRFLVGDAHKAFARRAWDAALAKREAVPVVKEDLTTVQAVAVPDLWSFLRNVLRQGAAIESQQGQQGYETFIAHIEDAASRQEKKLRAMLAASQQAAKGEGT